ncbi:MAG: ATP-grasp domain-containing protein [Candidatus Margulisiibacteriota bacterium]
MKKKIRVLFSGAGGSGATGIINGLRASGRYWIVAVDANRYSAGLYLADYGEVVPLVTHKDYFKRIKRLMDRHKIDVYMPLIEEELLPAYDFIKYNPGITLILPRREFTDLVLNKYNMVKAFQQAGINCPATYLDREIDKNTFRNKLFLKPISGRGSQGIAIIESKNDYVQYFARQSTYKQSDVILQQYIEGDEYTVSAVVGKKGWVYAVVPKKIIKKQGITYSSVTEKNPLIDAVVRKIQNIFRANGPFNVQLKIFKGKAYILEVNPRFSTTVVHTIAAGVNEIDCIIRDYLGIYDDKKVIPFKKGLVMLRHFTQLYLPYSAIK